jgi:hypothetical protein
MESVVRNFGALDQRIPSVRDRYLPSGQSRLPMVATAFRTRAKGREPVPCTDSVSHEQKQKVLPLLWIEHSTSRNRIGCGTRSELQSGALPGELKRRIGRDGRDQSRDDHQDSKLHITHISGGWSDHLL